MRQSVTHLPSRHDRSGFTLIEIMIVIAILGIIIGIAGPTWLRQRSLSQQRVCQENMAKIDGAKEQWALEKNQPGSATPGWADLVADDGAGYLKTQPSCPANGTYALGAVGQATACSITAAPWDHNQRPTFD